MISFLQSQEWEVFQQSLGRKTWRVDNQLIIQHKLPFGLNYLYCPRPHINNADSFFVQAEEIARTEKVIFLKIDPGTVSSLRGSPVESGTIEAIPGVNRLLRPAFSGTSNDMVVSNPLQPQKTLILDLSKSKEELFKEMHEKTRYNIRLAERRGVNVYNLNDFETFWNLLKETATRDGFHTHERSYYEKLFAVRSENFSNELFLAEYQDKVLAAALINFYKGRSLGTATYLHGASSREYKEVMAPSLLHWRIIKVAKERGFHYYDFWGIDEKRWPGLTRFKIGFGGEFREYPQSIDIIYRPWQYFLYHVLRKVALIR